MGFCRRCGDIVTGTRCKCGGTAVAPVLRWSSKFQSVDKWSQTYIARDVSPTRSPIRTDGTVSASQSGVASTGLRTEPNLCLHLATDCFPRPGLSYPSPSVPGHIDSHVDSSTQPSSPPKRSFNIVEQCPPSSRTTLAPEPGISQAPHALELSKAYGSVLQPKELLAAHSCAICSSEFQPDVTIFPDPSVPELSDRFLCRPCFITNGGSRGDCPICRRPVLILKSEGSFVETSGGVWHKKCFRCEGCHKNIGEAPMVDLLGQPSCADCFDSCLKRNSTPRRFHTLPGLERTDDRTPVTLLKESRSQEGSPAVDELEQRLGIMKSREGSPVLEELTQRLNVILNRTPRNSPPSISCSTSYLNKDRESSPLAQRTLERKKSATLIASRYGIDSVDTLTDAGTFCEARTSPPRQTMHTNNSHQDHPDSSTRPPLDTIEEMKSRFMNQVTLPRVSLEDPISPPDSLLHSTVMNSPTSTPYRIPRLPGLSGSPGLRHAVSASSLRSSRMSWMPSTPDLIPDILDTLTQSSGPSSPPTISPQVQSRDRFFKEHTPIKDVPLEHALPGMVTPRSRDSLNNSSIPTATLSSGSLCAKCGGSLFATGGGGRFVTVPELSASGPPKTYHTECFRCIICDGPFRETANGHAVFVRGEGGTCHIECAPTEKTQIKTVAGSSPTKSVSSDPISSPPLVPLTNTIQAIPKLSAGTSHTRPPISSPHHGNTLYSSSRCERPPPSAPSLSSIPSRFGSSAACPGCQKAVSPMEMGVVPGPQGSRWHATCLVCGGKGTGKARRDRSQPGCGKRLDSAAKRDAQGGVWCRECLLLLPLHMRHAKVETLLQQLVPSHTGRSAGSGRFIAPQVTGTTTIARQFTGRGGGESGILRQLTGGRLSPTRQLSGSPTKKLGLGTPRARPRSVIGMRSSKSVDEGRGMYLVGQLTGGGSSSLV